MATMDKKVLLSISEEELSTGESTRKRLPSKAGNIFVYCYRDVFFQSCPFFKYINLL